MSSILHISYIIYHTSAAERHGSTSRCINSSHKLVVIRSFNHPPGLSLESLNHTFPIPVKYFLQIFPLYGAQ